jgi:hypothetical protein
MRAARPLSVAEDVLLASASIEEDRQGSSEPDNVLHSARGGKSQDRLVIV